MRFFARFGTNQTYDQKFEKCFDELDKDLDHTVVRGKDCFVVNYHIPKVIDDIFIKEDNSESWLMLVGMPLVRGEGLKNFFRNASQALNHDIDGHFALLAFNAKESKFIFATDINNFIPVFYAIRSGTIYISSSELLLARILDCEPDPLGFYQGIHLGRTWGSQTRFKEIKKLQSAEIITVNRNVTCQKKRYWSPKQERLWTGNFDQILEEWLAILRDSVLAFYENSKIPKLSMDLTGGEDSRLVVAQCHALGLPFQVRVAGFPGDRDIALAEKAASRAGLELNVDYRKPISKQDVTSNITKICLSSDGYESFLSACLTYATGQDTSPRECHQLHFSGVPGGEVFRGTYYLRAKLIFPGAVNQFNFRSFIKLKFLLDFIPGLVNYSDADFLNDLYSHVERELMEVEGFPAGIQVDHLLRVFQVCLMGLTKKRPFYRPLGLNDITRTVYKIPPNYKRRGRLTRACTETLFPKLAFTKTQNGVPTIKMTPWRFPLFLPEISATVKKIVRGTVLRLFNMRQTSASLSFHHNLSHHSSAIETLFHDEPYSDWFSSPKSMVTGEFYNAQKLDTILRNAKQNKCNKVIVLGRIINQEIALRYVHNRL